jgi:hypothetical protein
MAKSDRPFVKSALAVAITVSMAITVPVYASGMEPAINRGNRSIIKHAGGDYIGVATATDGAGLFIEVWADDQQNLYAQYTQRGHAIAPAFLVDPSGASSVHVAMNASGDAIVVWLGSGEIYARFLPVNSTSVSGNPVLLSSNANGNVSSVSMDDAGNFNIVKVDSGTLYHFNSAGVLVASPEFSNNCATYSNNLIAYGSHLKGISYDAPYAATEYCTPSVSTNAVGNSVVAWEESGHIYAKRFSNTGVAIDLQPIVVDGTPAAVPAAIGSRSQNKVEYFSREPAVAMDDAGDFVVAWERIKVTNGDVKRKVQDCTYNPYTYDWSCGKKIVKYNKFKIASSLVAQHVINGVPVNSKGGVPVDHALIKSSTKRNEHVRIDTDSTGNFVAAWTVAFLRPGRFGNYYPTIQGNVQARKYKKTLSPDGGLVSVAKASRPLKNGDLAYAELPGVALDNQGSWQVTWNLQNLVTQTYTGYYGYTYSYQSAKSESFARYTPGKGVN